MGTTLSQPEGSLRSGGLGGEAVQRGAGWGGGTTLLQPASHMRPGGMVGRAMSKGGGGEGWG